MKEKLFKNYQKEWTPFGFRFQQFNLNTTPSYWLIACIVPEGKSRNALKSYLYEKNIETRNILSHYIYSLHIKSPSIKIHLETLPIFLKMEYVYLQAQI